METDRDVEDFLENHLERLCSAEFGKASCNDLTQLELVELGTLGHINGSSGLGQWQDGLNLLAALMAGCLHQRLLEKRDLNGG